MRGGPFRAVLSWGKRAGRPSLGAGCSPPSAPTGWGNQSFILRGSRQYVTVSPVGRKGSVGPSWGRAMKPGLYELQDSKGWGRLTSDRVCE